MRRIWLAIMIGSLAGACGTAIRAQEADGLSSAATTSSVTIHAEDGQKLVVYAAKFLPVGTLMEVIQELLPEDQELRIVPETIRNNVVIHGPTETVDVLLRLMRELDRSSPVIRVQMWVVAVPCARTGELEQKIGACAASEVGEMLKRATDDSWVRILDRCEVSALNDQVALVKTGQDMPVVSGSTVTRGGQVNNYQHQQFGMQTSLQPRFNGDSIDIALKYEKSEPQEQTQPETDAQLPGFKANSPGPGTVVRQAESTIRVISGGSAVFGGGSLRSREGCAEWRIIVAAEVR